MSDTRCGRASSRGEDPTVDRRRLDRGRLWRAAGLGVAVLVVSLGAQPANAGRTRPPAISSVKLAGITRSQAELPFVLPATDAASLATAVDIANGVGCGVQIDVSGTITANVVLTPRCPNPDDLGIRLRGPATLYGGIFAGCEGTDCAWASVEGLRVIATNDDAFDASRDGRLAVLDSVGEVNGAFSNVLTAHQNARLLALASSGRSLSSETSPPLAFIQDSRAIIAGLGEFRTGSKVGDSVLLVGGGNASSHPVVALLGHTLGCSVAQQNAVASVPGPGGHSTLWWAGAKPKCPISLDLHWNEGATIESFGAGQRMPLPFAIPSWLDGTAYLEVDVSF